MHLLWGCRPGARGGRGAAGRGGRRAAPGREPRRSAPSPSGGEGEPQLRDGAPRRQGARVRSPRRRDTMKRLGDIMLPDLPHRNPCNKVTPGERALRGAAGGAAGPRGSGAWGRATRLQMTAAQPTAGRPGAGDCGGGQPAGGVRGQRQTQSGHWGTC